MIYIILMTSAGSFLFVGCLQLEKAMGKHMNQTCRYRMLVAVMFTYLVPWVWMKNIYRNMGVSFQVGRSSAAASGDFVLTDVVVHSTDGLAVTLNYGIMLFIVGLWMFATVIVMICRCGSYFRSRHALMQSIVSCGTGVPEELVLRLKREFHIRRRIKIVRISDGKPSMTMGILRPVVFIQNDCSEDELEHILRHEFTHIARGDLLVKMLMQLVCCLHCFNPLVYDLNRKLERVCEKACDERVVRNMPEDEKEAYGHLIVRSMKESREPSDRKVLFGNFFSSNEKLAEERVKVIMEKRKRKFWEKIVVAGLFAALLFVDSLTAMAYPRVYSVEEASTEAARITAHGTSVLVLGVAKYNEAELDHPLLYDAQIVTADGEILPAPVQTRAFCLFHKWQDAEFDTHAKNDDGGCVVTAYKCKYCSRCDTIKVGELIGTYRYTVCYHNY